MKEIIKNNSIFLFPYALIMSVCGVCLWLYPKEVIHLWINSFHAPGWDFFFKYFTYMGSGVVAIVITLILLFVSYRHAAFILSSYLSSSLIVQLLKRIIFPHVQRPVAFFEGKARLYLVPGTDPHMMQSFPSGHAATFFAVFLGLALLSKNNLHKLFFLCIALVGSFSRIYLSEHFLVDVVTGSLVGVVTTVIMFYLYTAYPQGWYDKKIEIKK